jgi:hypothetical protein
MAGEFQLHADELAPRVALGVIPVGDRESRCVRVRVGQHRVEEPAAVGGQRRWTRRGEWIGVE